MNILLFLVVLSTAIFLLLILASRRYQNPDPHILSERLQVIFTPTGAELLLNNDSPITFTDTGLLIHLTEDEIINLNRVINNRYGENTFLRTL